MDREREKYREKQRKREREREREREYAPGERSIGGGAVEGSASTGYCITHNIHLCPCEERKRTRGMERSCDVAVVAVPSTHHASLVLLIDAASFIRTGARLHTTGDTRSVLLSCLARGLNVQRKRKRNRERERKDWPESA